MGKPNPNCPICKGTGRDHRFSEISNGESDPCDCLSAPTTAFEQAMEQIEQNTGDPQLKPCPFCGSDGLLFKGRGRLPNHKTGFGWSVCCSKCTVTLLLLCATKPEAAEVWNKRHEDSQNNPVA